MKLNIKPLIVKLFSNLANEACKLFHLNKENFEKIGETDY